MRKILFCFILSLAVVGCTSRHNRQERFLDNQEDAPLQGDTTTVDEHHSFSQFHALSIYDASILEIRLGNQYEVEVGGQKMYADAQKVSREGDELSIKFADHDSNHRKTVIRITVPSLRRLKVVGCGKLSVFGEEMRSSSFDIDLQRVNVAILSPCIKANEVSVSLQGVMIFQSHVDCDAFKLSAPSVDHVKVFGRARHRKIDAADITHIDVSGLKN